MEHLKQTKHVWFEKSKLVGEGKEEAVEGVGRLLSAPWWRNPVTGLLFKQRAWSQLYPALSGPEANSHHTAALVLLLPHLPKPLLEPKLPALLPLVVRALSSPATALHALNCLSDFVSLDVALLASHLQVSWISKLIKKPPMSKRIIDLTGGRRPLPYAG